MLRRKLDRIVGRIRMPPDVERNLRALEADSVKKVQEAQAAKIRVDDLIRTTAIHLRVPDGWTFDPTTRSYKRKKS
jgi:hypothetical protein